MIHTVYKTINNLNDKYYIGVHTCNCENTCEYLGSGKALKLAIKKYGKENFSKTILAKFKKKKHAYMFERVIVDFRSPDSYNMCQGGEGGGKNSIPCIWNGVTYTSFKAAAEDLGISEALFNKWYRGISKPSDKINFEFEGKTYASYASCGRKIGFSEANIRTWVKKGLTAIPDSSRGIEIFGVHYKTKLAAAKSLGVSPSTITNYCKNPNSFKGYYLIKGKKYLTQKQAADKLGVWPQTISKWIADPKNKKCIQVKP